MTAMMTMSRVQGALARAAVYGLLARAFAHPTPDQPAAIGQAAQAVATAPAAVRRQVEALARTLPAPADLGAAWTRLFTHSNSRDCPAFETAYTAQEVFQQARQMADIAGFYRAFGVEAAPSGERPDHICVELEFMRLLALKEAYAHERLGAPRAAQCRRAQRLFLGEHLGCWGPAFGQRLAALDRDGWHGRAARLLCDWLAHECATLTVAPAVVCDAPALSWPEPDDGACGAELDSVDDGCGGCPLAGGSGADQNAPSPQGIPLPLL